MHGCHLIPQTRFSWLFYSNFLFISFAELQSEKEKLQKKYVHVMQILESEKTAKWQLLQQCEEQGQLISSLKSQVYNLKKESHKSAFFAVSLAPPPSPTTEIKWVPKEKWLTNQRGAKLEPFMQFVGNMSVYTKAASQVHRMVHKS